MADLTNHPQHQQAMELDAEKPMGLDETPEKQAREADGVDPAHLKLSQEQYNRIANMLVVHLREEEAQHDDEPNWQGTRQSQLAEW